MTDETIELREITIHLHPTAIDTVERIAQRENTDVDAVISALCYTGASLWAVTPDLTAMMAAATEFRESMRGVNGGGRGVSQ